MSRTTDHPYKNPGLYFLQTALYHMPAAYAHLTGNPGNAGIDGMVRFYPVEDGVLVNAEVYGLPESDGDCELDIFGFHIHQGDSCTGNAQDPFANAGEHYNPDHCPHPEHMGDMPPLFGDDGFAWMLYFTDRFSIEDIVGRTVIVHSRPDDFTTQPSGNAGTKIACGTIQSVV